MTHDALRVAIQPLHGTAADFDALLARAADVGYVLLGEASHGTHDFYVGFTTSHGTVAAASDWDHPVERSG